MNWVAEWAKPSHNWLWPCLSVWHWIGNVLIGVFVCVCVCLLLHPFHCNNGLYSLFLSCSVSAAVLKRISGNTRGGGGQRESEREGESQKVSGKYGDLGLCLAERSRDGLVYPHFVSKFFNMLSFKRDKYGDATLQKGSGVLTACCALDCQHCKLLQRSLKRRLLKRHCCVHLKNHFYTFNIFRNTFQFFNFNSPAVRNV